MSEKILSRRGLLRNTVLSMGALMAGKAYADSTLKACGLTPAQTEGPFYPIADQLDKDNDLTRVKGLGRQARGEVVFLRGVVQDEFCRPVKGALVEIWQACDTGKYNHPGDPNTASLDPDFQYWGRNLSNEKGEYNFKTIIPGEYPATSTWERPPHIHIKIHLRGFEELTTQMYFGGHRLNSGDRILRSLSAEDRRNVTIEFKEELGPDGVKRKVGTFNISLKSL
jgi:protocatechuate 3,4-dioxygenase beta subunit